MPAREGLTTAQRSRITPTRSTRGSEIRCLEPFADDLDHLRPAVRQDIVTCLVGTDHVGLRNIDDEPAEGVFVCLAGCDKKDGEARVG